MSVGQAMFPVAMLLSAQDWLQHDDLPSIPCGSGQVWEPGLAAFYACLGCQRVEVSEVRDRVPQRSVILEEVR